MARRLVPLSHDEFVLVCQRLDEGEPTRADLKAAAMHLAAVLVAKAPGASVEVRVPPFVAVQCVAGARHTRGTPPAVVEMDAPTWIALGRGQMEWADATLRASGERSDLTDLLPLDIA